MSTPIPQDRRPATPRRGVPTKTPLLGRLLRLSSKKRRERAEYDWEDHEQIEDEDGSSLVDRLDRTNESFNDGDSCTDTVSRGAESIGDGASMYDVCGTIDESMCGLHTCNDSKERVKIKVLREVSFEHDWLLDGTDSEGDDEVQNVKARQRRKFGDAALDQMLGMLEIENASYATSGSSCGSYLDGDSNSIPGSKADDAGARMEEGEEVIEFADFSYFDSEKGASGDAEHGESNNGLVSGKDDVDVFVPEGNLQNDVLYEYERTEPGEEKPQSTSSQAEGANVVEEGAAGGEDIINHAAAEESSPSYEPPSSIQCLVSDLDAELDVTIKSLDVPAETSAATESACSSLDDDCTNIVDAIEDQEQPIPCQSRKQHKQSLLMSSALLEGLPLPMPSASSDDPLASFSRRIQTKHVASKARENIEANRVDAAQLEDELLEAKLADVIHSGYYASAGQYCDSDHYDSIVMEEVSNVPWPFHIIDLKESLFGDDDEPDSEEDSDESTDRLNFDSYIANRLSELDLATGEIMKCVLSRVSQKEDAIKDGIEGVYTAELDVSTALLFAQTSRESLHHAKNGYEVASGRHNVVLGALDVVHYADCKDRLRYLLQTVDRISSIRDQEAQWWMDVTAKTIRPDRYQTLVDEARGLIELVSGEEVLNNAISLRTMRDRMINLPDALLRRIEDSLADLFGRIVTSGEKHSPSRFEGYLLEYEALLRSWLSCCQLRAGNDRNAEHLPLIATEWSGCILKILNFEIRRSFACAMLEQGGFDNDDDEETLENIKSQLNQMKFASTDEADLESLSNRLLVMRLGGGHNSGALSSTFFHLSSRLVELMNLYSVSLQWHSAIIGRLAGAVDPAPRNAEDVADQPGCELDESESDHHTAVSSLSSDRQSVSTRDEASIDAVSTSVPEHLEIETDAPSSLAEHRAIEKSMEHIRRSLWQKCETVLISVVEFYNSQGGDLGVQSADSTDAATGNLRLTYVVLLQFTSYSRFFLSKDEGGEECSALKNELSKLYHTHIRSVFVEAMKTTGTLLRHEAWQLAPLELSAGAFKDEASGPRCKECRLPGQSCVQCNATTMQAIYEAVGDLLLGSAGDKRKSEHQPLITARSEDRGYGYCTSFAQYVEVTPPDHPVSVEHGNASQQPSPDNDALLRLKGCFGASSHDFSSMMQQFVEMNPCGERSLSILTQSSANGLVKWTARLLAIGDALPLVADDASTAVIKLFDLYLLTVIRFCAGSKVNEDVLIGFGRGTSARSASAATVSLTMEADALAPLPREVESFQRTQNFIRNSRKRLENMVDLDKFQSLDEDMCLGSPRSNDAAHNSAKQLEKEAAAACSCLFAAILVDVASKIFGDGQGHGAPQQPWDDLRDITSLIEKEDVAKDAKPESLEEYAIAAVSAVPNLVTQATRFATVNALSGKEMIFKIICSGRLWEDNILQEQSNAYIDDLCERSACIWGYMSSSMRLPQPTLHFTWDQLVRSSFLLLLEGFSKVTKCSTEGRSLMSMDLATLSHGLIPESVQAEIEDEYKKISPPPQACREEMMRYVDTFVKVFYFPDEDTLNWIRDNSENYHRDHSLSLITSKAAVSKQDKKSMADNVADIYNQIM